MEGKSVWFWKNSANYNRIGRIIIRFTSSCCHLRLHVVTKLMHQLTRTQRPTHPSSMFHHGTLTWDPASWIEIVTIRIQISQPKSRFWPPKSKSIGIEILPQNSATHHRDLPCCRPNQSYCCRVWSSAEDKLSTLKSSSLICAAVSWRALFYSWGLAFSRNSMKGKR